MTTALLDGNVTDQNEAAVPGALVYVYDGRGETGGLADLTDSMAQAIENPVTAGEDGYWSAYALSDQFYTLAYYWGGRKRYVEANVLLGSAGINTDPNVRAVVAAHFGTLALAQAAVIAAPAAVLEGYYAAGDAPFATYRAVAAQPTHAGKFQDAAGTWFEIVPCPLIGIDPRWLGAVGDDRDADHACLNNAAAVAANFGAPLWIGAGKTYRVISDPGVNATQNGLLFPAPSVGNVTKIHGDGTGTIKRKAFSTTTVFVGARVVSLTATAGQTYRVENVTIDGNEQNCTFNNSTFVHLYEYEQSHNLAWVGSLVQLGKVVVSDVTMANALGDAFTLNQNAASLFITRLKETGRTRRPRSGIGFSYIPTYCMIRDSEVVHIDFEPIVAAPANNLVEIDNLLVHSSFDLGGFSTNSRVNVKGRGIKMVRDSGINNERFSVAYANATFVDCDFKGMPAVEGRCQILASQFTMIGGSLEIAVNPSDATMAIPVRVVSLLATDYVRLESVKLFAPPAITSVASYTLSSDYGSEVYNRTGCYFQPEYNAVPSVQLNYKSQTANFTVGNTVTGGTSGATGVIAQDLDSGAGGYLVLTGVTGTFVTAETITGSGGGSATTNGAATAISQKIELINCETVGNLLPVPFNAYRCGRMVLKGGRLRGSTSVWRLSASTGFVSHLAVDDPLLWANVGDVAMPMGTFTAITGTASFKLSGAWNGELMAATVDGTNPSITDWTVDATMLVDSTPASRIRGFPGLRAALRIPSTAVSDWDYLNSSTPGSNTAWVVRPKFSTGSKTFDWPSLATATQQTTTVTVTGAVVGDKVDVSMSTALSGTRMWGEVTASDTVTVYQRNDTGGAVDVASGTLSATVMKVT